MAQILDCLHPRFRVLSVEAGADDFAELEEAFRLAGLRVPGDYRRLLEEGSHIELILDGRRYLRVWSPTEAVDRTFGYDVWRFFGPAVALADDGGAADVRARGGPVRPRDLPDVVR